MRQKRSYASTAWAACIVANYDEKRFQTYESRSDASLVFEVGFPGRKTRNSLIRELNTNSQASTTRTPASLLHEYWVPQSTDEKFPLTCIRQKLTSKHNSDSLTLSIATRCDKKKRKRLEYARSAETANLLCEFGSPCQQTRNSLTHGSQRPEGGTVWHNPFRLGAKACLSYETLAWVGHPRLNPSSSSDDLHYNHQGASQISS